MQSGNEYQSRGPPQEYYRGMFVDTACGSDKVHNYQEMHDLLASLSNSYPSDVNLFSAGMSEGYGGSENSLKIPVIHIPSTQKPRQTLFLAAGHHPEFSGSETVYLVAKRILESYHTDNPNVRAMRRNTDIIVIPQVDVDLYNNLDKYDPDDPGGYWGQAYGLFTDIKGGISHTRSKEADCNFYGHQRQYTLTMGYPAPKQSLSVKEAVDVAIRNYGMPLLAFDYHESIYDQSIVIQQSPEGKILKGFTDPRVIQTDFVVAESDPSMDALSLIDDPVIGTLSLPLYALEEVARSFPERVDFSEERIDPDRHYTFREFLASKGAESFIFETTSDANLEERIEMNLIATDRILARYFLDI